jgi:hypothetical protein
MNLPCCRLSQGCGGGGGAVVLPAALGIGKGEVYLNQGQVAAIAPGGFPSVFSDYPRVSVHDGKVSATVYVGKFKN